MFGIRTLLGFVLLGASSAAIALPTAYRCDNCSDAQYRVLATNKARGLNQGTGYVYTFDMTRALLRKFAISREAGPGGTFTYYADTVSTTSAEKDNFTTMRGAWTASGGTMGGAQIIDYQGSPPGSPSFPTQVTTYINGSNYGFYGIVVTPSLQLYMTNYVEAYMNNVFQNDPHSAVSQTWTWAFNAAPLLKYEGTADPPHFTATVKIPGGGEATYTLDSTVRPPKWVLTKLIDKNQNNVPLTAAQVAPTNGNTINYDFNNDHTGLPSFEYYLSNGLHIPFVHLGGWQVACVDIHDGGSHCTAQPN